MPPTSTNPWKKIVGVLFIELIVVAVIFLTPVRDWLGISSAAAVVQRLRDGRAALGNWAPLAYMALYTLATVFALPGSLLTLGSGAIFGAIEGGLWTVLGATWGATGSFLIGRYAAGELTRKLFEKGGRLARLEAGIVADGFWFALSIRLAPIFPFNAVNYLLSLTPLTLKQYVLSTFVGIIPGTFAYAWLGQESSAALTGQVRGQLFFTLAALALLSALPLLLKRKKAAEPPVS